MWCQPRYDVEGNASLERCIYIRFLFMITFLGAVNLRKKMSNIPGVVSLSLTRKDPCMFPGACSILMASFLETFAKNHLSPK